jgi:hypothetical protein
VLVEAAVAAVQMVGALVGAQLVVRPVQGELAAGDPAGVAAGGGAHVVPVGVGVLDRRAAEDDVGQPAVAVGGVELEQPGAEVRDHRGAVPAAQGDPGDREVVEGDRVGVGHRCSPGRIGRWLRLSDGS